jgi:hypothetical protein
MRRGSAAGGGKICRYGINCRGGRTVPETKIPCFIDLSAMARPLLMLRRQY